jgi:hypothetical protein
MDDETISKLSALDWENTGPRLLEFARRWAAMVYGWREGSTLPNGMSIEDVAKDAVAAFATGDRKLNPRFEIVVQLKGAIRSILWRIHRKSGDKLTSAESPEFFDAQLEEAPDPAAKLASDDFCSRFIEQLSADEKIVRSTELLRIVQAYAGGAETVEEVAEKTGFGAKRIYELRRHLKEAATRVLRIMNRKEKAI